MSRHEPTEPGFFGMLLLILLFAAVAIWPVWIILAAWAIEAAA